MVSGTVNSSVQMGNLNSPALQGGDLDCVAPDCEVFLINQAGSQQAAGGILGFRVEGLDRQSGICCLGQHSTLSSTLPG